MAELVAEADAVRAVAHTNKYNIKKLIGSRKQYFVYCQNIWHLFLGVAISGYEAAIIGIALNVR